MSVYTDTLRSARWRQLKWRRILLSRFSCERCGSRYFGRTPRQAKRHFHLHHVTYVRVGREHIDDVRVLCPPCHKTVHGLLEENQ